MSYFTIQLTRDRGCTKLARMNYPTIVLAILVAIFEFLYWRLVKLNADLLTLNQQLLDRNEGYQAEIVSQYRIILDHLL